MAVTATTPNIETLRALPGDDVRQILWRFTDRFDLQMLVQSVRAVARGPVARLVAAGARNTHEWTEEKNSLLPIYDEAGITSVFMDPEEGGYIAGPKNLPLSLVAYELAWVDAGAATCSLATCLALAPIHERGTPEQRRYYLSRCVPPQPGENREPSRGAFCLTEPIPYVGVDTGVLGGRVRIQHWNEGEEPVLQVEKRGRFITNMGFANFVTAAVESDDPRIKGTLMVILEQTDTGTFDRGTPTRKLVHQLSSTRDPVFNLTVPASRIIGGYTVKDGVIIPRYSHGEVIEAVFRRTRVGVGLMTSAKLLSAIEPVIRYGRSRFRGSTSGGQGTPRYELGLQMKQDVLHRLVDVWAAGEAGASLGFATARLFDRLDPIEREKNKLLEAKNLKGSALIKQRRQASKDALAFLAGQRPDLAEDVVVRTTILDAEANVLCPSCKLWNTGQGAHMMREAVSLMGGYGITEDCPGFLGQKWMDAQLEATYEGPEAVQRRQLSVTMTDDVFLALFRQWTKDMRTLANTQPELGARALASAMELWLWTLHHLLNFTDAFGDTLYHSSRQGVTFALADALAWLMASRCQILDILELQQKGPGAVSEGLEGTLQFLGDLAHVQASHAAGEVGRICAELAFGYNQHPDPDDEGCATCYQREGSDAMEKLIPGIWESACGNPKACALGPCVRLYDLDQFIRLRGRLDGCLTGSRLAKDRAAESLSKVMIPEALDYPA